MTIDTGLLTTLLNTFQDAFTGGFSRIYPDAMKLLAILAALEVAIAAIWWAIAQEEAIVTIARKCIQIGFFVFVVTQYQPLITAVLDGFVSTGLKAGGGGSLNLIKDPSLIIDYGFAATAPIFDHLKDFGILSAGLVDIVLSGLAGILVLLAFFALAIQVFITYLEFFIIAVLGLILIPFGVLKHTSFIAEKVFGAIIAFGIRLMVLAFILSVASPTLASITLPPNPPWQQVFVMLLAALTIMGLAWHAPSIASGLISGAPSLTAGAAVGMVAAGAGALTGAAIAAKDTAKAGVAATRSAAGAATGGGVAGGGIAAGGGGGTTAAASTAGAGAADSSASEPNARASGAPNWAQKFQRMRSLIPTESPAGAGISAPIRYE